MNLWYQLRLYVYIRKLLLRGQDLSTTLLQLRKQLLKIDSRVVFAKFFEVPSTAVVELSRTPDVAVAKVVQANGHLNQALIKRPRWALNVSP